MTVETLQVEVKGVVKRIAEKGRKRQHRLSCGDIRGSTLLGAITVNPGFKVFRSK
jgi:hypothetical protein